MLIDRKPKPSRQLPGPQGTFGAGGVIGLLSALVGAGGAFVSVPFMTWCNVPIHNAVATSAALGFPIALAGTIGYIIAGWSLPEMPSGAIGFIYLPALMAIAAASVLTAPIGARLAHRLRHVAAAARVRGAAVRAGGLHALQGNRRMTTVRSSRARLAIARTIGKDADDGVPRKPSRAQRHPPAAQAEHRRSRTSARPRSRSSSRISS